MAHLPSGTVTFLFTDIEGSTPLAGQFPAAWEAAQRRHHALLREAFKAHGGHIFKTVGDAFLVAFETADSALQAAVAAQRALQAEAWAATPIRVRMGLHTGAANPLDGDYHGYMTLAQAARVMSAAHGNQTLISSATHALVAPRLPTDVSLRDLGEHRLKGLLAPERLWQVDIAGLQQDFPPLQSLNGIPNNLPLQLTSFVGREKEIADVQNLLVSTRLLTLSGPGGTGKTRLALQLAADVLPEFPHGAWVVELAQLADPAFVIQAIMAVFGLREMPGRTSTAIVADYLHGKTLLLLLDNCEHLIDVCARLADDLLRVCPQLKILATSRESLGVSGETIYRIPSLALPNTASPTSEALLRSDAGHLFVERARSAQPRFVLTPDNTPAIAALCTRLDGIPLAIELAAARVRVLTPEQIASRLDDRFGLLVGGSRTAMPRQQTLRALIDWSYDLLPEDERRLLRALSVFAGGWSLEAAEAVGEGADVSDALDALAALENKSLVVVDDAGSTARYRLLETIRQYARDKLLDAGEAAGVRNRHLAYFVGLVESCRPKLIGPKMVEALDQLEQEEDNVRAALDWALDHDPLAALQLVAVLGTYWARRASSADGMRWVQAALARGEAAIEPSPAPSPEYLLTKARVYNAAAAMNLQLGENKAAREAIEASISLAREMGAVDVLRHSLGLGATIAGFNGDLDTARAWLTESVALARQADDIYVLGLYGALNMFFTMLSGAPVPPDLEQEALRAARKCGNPWVIALTMQNVGRSASMQGRLDMALARLEEADGYVVQLQDQDLQIMNQSELAHVLRRLGRLAEAAAKYRATLPRFRERGQFAALAHEIESLGFVAIAAGQSERAAMLLGAAEAQRAAIDSHMLLPEQREYDGYVAKLRSQMAADAFDAAWSHGKRMTLDEVMALAAEEQGGGNSTVC